ncbi:unnamed protein product [Cercopithifilaria johnstoni]|uniref:Uncharacterized protein n=1 Tax=Cercopithifilaria johnstoni TaxID=2874296 RepID=A0A8J2MEX2_9BILA|nr:unnamed protein product [Cercopithifilaria johnstoni]
MSLLPMKSLSASLPVLFIEARLQGPPEIIFSQMGISFDADKCNVALLMRTSGVLLVASVGSYMMYRVCSRLLGRNFIWTILEQACFDLLARDEKYLLNSKMSYIASDEYDNYCSVELTDDEESDCDSHNPSTMPYSDHLGRALQICDSPIENLRRRSKMALKHPKRPASIASQSSTNAELTSSGKSASLHLLWDDPQWDEETDCYFYGDAVQHDHYSVSSDVSNMTEFRAAKGLFEESDDRCKMNKDDQKSNENLNREERNSDLENNDFIQKNCMVDSKHLYHITTGFITRTNSMSISSERSSQSFPSLRQRLIANTPSGGLLELVQSSTKSPMTTADHMMASMTDSGISRGTISTSNLQSSIRSSEPDRKGEICSSEDEVLDMMTLVTLKTKRNSIIRRSNSKLISEDRCSIATSARSMEWFEDNYCPFITGEHLKESLDDSLAACFSRSNLNQIHPSSSNNRQNHLYNVTRDLMAWAKEQFAPKSSQLRALQSLYISRPHWRRIGLKRSSNCSEQFLSSLLHLMFIRGIPFFNCSDVLIAAKVSPFTFNSFYTL